MGDAVLIELFSAVRAMEKSGIPVAPRHATVRTVGKGLTIRVRLAEGGRISDVEMVPANVVQRLWTIRDGKHNSFPHTKLPHPLVVADVDPTTLKGKDGSVDRATVLKIVREQGVNLKLMTSWPGRTLVAKVQERGRLLSALREGEAAAIPTMFDRFLAVAEHVETFFQELTDHLVAKVETGIQEWSDAAPGVFFVEGVSLYFDVDAIEFARDVGYAGQVDHVSRALLDAERFTARGHCMLADTPNVEFFQGPFPQINLPALGETCLFAKNADTPAAARYRRTASDAISVGRDVVAKLAGILTDLSLPHRKNVNWRLVPSEKPKSSDLLLAYVEENLDVAMVGILAGDTDEDEDDDGVNQEARARAAYNHYTSQIFAALRATAAELTKLPVNFLVLRRVDTGNRKVLMSASVSCAKLEQASRVWIEASSNVPSWLKIPVYIAVQKQVVAMNPPVLAPLSASPLTRTAYRRDGTFDTVHGFPLRDAFALFFDQGDVRLRARRLLSIALRHSEPLLAYIGDRLRRGEIIKIHTHLRQAALDRAALLGIALFKLDRTKEIYMSEAAFKLGQLLSVADAVHVGYCHDVRKSQIPPAILGASLLPVAQSRPVAALAMLCRRWKPYAAWAKKYMATTTDNPEIIKEIEDKKEQSRRWAMWRGAYLVNSADEIARELSGRLSESADDVFRAELLLGYLAGVKIEKKADGGSDKLGIDDQE